MQKKILGVIPARGGSKSIPQKNIKLLGDKPLIAYAIDAGERSKYITDCVVSTDSEEIRETALSWGGSAPFLRPPELATDTALAIPTIQHAVREMETRNSVQYDYVIMLQPTSPLRTADHIDTALAALIESDADSTISVVGVDNWHPMKMKKIQDGFLVDYEKPFVENPPRQKLPPVYMVNGALYATKRNVFMRHNTFQGTHCIPYVMEAAVSVNIDTESDFVLAEYYMGRS